MELKLNNKFKEDLIALVINARRDVLKCPKDSCKDCVMCNVIECYGVRLNLPMIGKLQNEDVRKIMSTTKIKIKDNRVYIYGEAIKEKLELREEKIIEWIETDKPICKL